MSLILSSPSPSPSRHPHSESSPLRIIPTPNHPHSESECYRLFLHRDFCILSASLELGTRALPVNISFESPVRGHSNRHFDGRRVTVVGVHGTHAAASHPSRSILGRFDAFHLAL